MKNRLVFAISALILILTSVFVSCANNESSADMTSLTGSDSESTVALSDAEETVLSTEPLDNEVSDEEVSEANECVHGEDTAFVVVSDGGTYSIFPDTKTGSYLSEFTSVTGDGVITLSLSDGRIMELPYGEIVYDESDDIYRTSINELDFMITESLDSNNNRVQVFECIEPIDYFSNSLTSMIIVTYYPETEKGSLQIWFTYEDDGEEYTFHYADGQTSSKTILYDEETGTHYFAESETEQE